MEKKKHISLDEISNKLPFGVPENYFDQFAVQFDNQIAIKHVSFVSRYRPWMYVAAVFVGVLLFGRVFFTAYQNNQAANTENYEMYVMSQVDEDEIIDYYLTEGNN